MESLNLAAWILIGVLSILLLILLILLIILIIKGIQISKEVKKIVITGQGIADKTDDIITSVRSVTSIGGVVKNFVGRYTNNKTKKGGSHGQ